MNEWIRLPGVNPYMGFVEMVKFRSFITSGLTAIIVNVSGPSNSVINLGCGRKPITMNSICMLLGCTHSCIR